MSTRHSREQFFLRVTTRCLTDDLGLAASFASEPVESLDHNVARAFVTMRSQSPVGQEKVQPLTTKVDVYTLHAGRWRGATWHDEDHDAVWLLACGIHRSGERGDAYPYIKQLDARGDLFPNEDDYEILFELQEHSFAQALVTDPARIVSDARSTPGVEKREVVGDRLRVAVLIEIADNVEACWLAVSMRLLPGELPVPNDWLPSLLAAFFPDALNPLELRVAEGMPTRAADPDEAVFVDYRPVRSS